MKSMLENCKNLKFCNNEIKILSSLNEQNLLQIEELAKELCED